MCIGDRYRIGEALFEVTQPRVTCYRVGIRMDEPAMPSLLVAHHRPGFYLRVLEEGSVEAGEEIVKVADGPERLTVAQVDALLYLPDKPRALLERALRVPALSEGWQGSFRELLAKGDRGTPATPAWRGFRSLRVAGIRRESASISSFVLVPADDGAATPAAAPGQYLTLRVRPDGGAPALTRSYSLSTVPDDHGYRISVKREGAASRYLHDAREGRRHPGGRRAARRLRPAGGGTARRAHQRRRRRHAGPRDAPRAGGGADHARRSGGCTARATATSTPSRPRSTRCSPRCPAVTASSRTAGPPRDPPGTDHDLSGRLDAAALDRLGVPADADHYICGPEEFMRAIGAALAARGVAPERIATEIFGAVPTYSSGIVKAGDRAPHAPDGPAGDGPVVTFSRSSLAVPWDARYPSLLDFAEACDVPVGFGCRNGVCHNCESGLLAGDVGYHIEPLEPPPDDRLLVCCTRPGSELTLDL